jgi:hypothetical protein
VTPLPPVEIGEGGDTSLAPPSATASFADPGDDPDGFFDQDLD